MKTLLNDGRPTESISVFKEGVQNTNGIRIKQSCRKAGISYQAGIAKRKQPKRKI